MAAHTASPAPQTPPAPQQKNGPRRAGHPARRSLKWSLIGMVLACWVLPVLLIVGGAGGYILHSIAAQAQSSLRLTSENAMDLVTTRMDAAMASSRKASTIPAIREAWQRYTQDGEAVALYEDVNLFLYQQYKYDEKFLNVVVTFLDEPSLSFYTTNVAAGGTAQGVRKYRQYLESDVLAQSAALGTSTAFVQQEGHLYLVRNLVDAAYRPYAVLAMEVNSRVLFPELQNLAGVQAVDVWLNGTCLPLTEPAGSTQPAAGAAFAGSAALADSAPAAGTAAPQNAQAAVLAPPAGSAAPQNVQAAALSPPAGTADGLWVQRCAGGFCVQARAARPAYTLSLAAQVEPAGLRRQQRAAALALAALAALLAPLLGFVLRFFRRKVTQPVDALVAAAGQIEQGSFGVQVEPAALTSRELGYLGDSFNSMSATLKNQFERIYKEELALRDARIMALQSQINPHFLNNTLEIINWEARMSGDVKVCSMLESLSTMLEAAMDRRQRPLVHLSEELMYADAYLYIIRERLGKRLTVEKDIDESVLDAYVPRLVLQPVMENAVEHGIAPTQQGLIVLRAHRDGRWLLLQVENDGVTSPDDLARIHTLLSDEPAPAGERSASLGIRNVHQRLRILYGPESGLFVEITKNGRTLFTMKIDLAQERQEYPRSSN